MTELVQAAEIDEQAPLPNGWIEEPDGWGGHAFWPVVRYLEKLDGLPNTERVFVDRNGTHILTTPAHWPAIPQAVLVRAAVQCSRLREAGR